MRRERQGGCGLQDKGRDERDTKRSSADSVREVATRPAQVQGTSLAVDKAEAGADCSQAEVCGTVRTTGGGRTVRMVPTDRPEVESEGLVGNLPSRCGLRPNPVGRGWRTVLGIDLTPRRRYRSYIARLERVLRLRSEEDNYLRDRLDRACSRIDHLRAYIRGLEQTNDLLNDEVMRMQAARLRHRGADGRFVRRQPEPASARTGEREKSDRYGCTHLPG